MDGSDHDCSPGEAPPTSAAAGISRSYRSPSDSTSTVTPGIELRSLLTSQDEKTNKASSSKTKRETTYQSINVYSKPSTLSSTNQKGTPGTLRIVWEDVGGPSDFFSINVDLSWNCRDTINAEHDNKSMISFSSSLDELLTVRICTDETVEIPQVEMTKWGGERLPVLEFPNGPEAAMGFFEALKVHLYTYPLEDSYRRGKIYAVEKVPRMRRVVPTLTMINDSPAMDPRDTVARNRRRTQRRNQGDISNASRSVFERDTGILVLQEFAKITQLARNIGEGLTLMFDERKRQQEDERKEREWRARQRALDLFAEREVGDDNRPLPLFFKLNEPRGRQITLKVWESFFDEEGRLLDIVASKQAIFSGGLEPDIRPRAWPFLLKAYKWESSRKEREEKLKSFREEYERVSKEWAEFDIHAEALDASFSLEEKRLKERAERLPKKECQFLQTKEQIEKDIVRTDRHMPAFNGDESALSTLMSRVLNIYAWYNEEIGYCQGMSDMLSPIVYVMGEENEALAFWCFASLMKDKQENFRVDQAGIRSQLCVLRELIASADPKIGQFFDRTDPDLYTCFRWIIVQFKREFPFEEIARLWEAFWTEQVGGDVLHLYVAVGLLKAHRRGILGLEIGAFDALLRYINDMSMRIEVDFALKHGEKCFRDLMGEVNRREKSRVR